MMSSACISSNFQRRPGLKPILLAAVALVFSGCATLPAPAEQIDPKAVTAYATEAAFIARPASWPTDHWWEDVGDAQLSQLITEGLAGASDMWIADARFAAARAQTGSARAALLPTLNVGGSVTGMKSSYNALLPRGAVREGWQDFDQASLDAGWTLDFWGKNRAALRSAEAEAKAAEAETQAARLTVSTAIAATYADLTSLYRERDAVSEARIVRGKTADLMEERRGSGLEHEGAVARARSGEQGTEAELAGIDEQITITRYRIAALMGAGPDRGLKIERPTLPTDKQFGLPARLPAELLGRRPDVVAARYRAEAAAQRIKQAKAGFYPNVDLKALIGFQSLGLGNLFLSDSTFAAAGPTVSLPIFDGGRLRAQYRGAEADYAQAVASYDDALTQALREVADTAASSHALITRLDRARAAEANAHIAWSTANNRYRGGLATYLDVLTAEDALIASRRNVAALEARAFTLDVALIRALGGGYRS